MKIPLSEISFSTLSLVDIGRVFWWRNRLFRGILLEHAIDIKNIFDCGLIANLIEKKYFVKSWITDFELEGFGLVIEHEVISVTVYPKEWTFSMLKDAALLVLNINEISLKFGYQTKDCHGYNVLFNNSQPIYVDLGSFTKVLTLTDTLLSYNDFMQSYYYPLKIWQTGGEYWGLRSAARAGSLLPQAAYLKYRWPIFRFINSSSLNKFLSAFNALVTFDHIDPIKLRLRLPSWSLPLLRCVSKLFYFGKMTCLNKKLKKLDIPSDITKWSNYHDEYIQSENLKSTARFDYIIKKILCLDIKSVLEFAGNQGILALLLAKNDQLETIICTDADSFALDKGYCFAKDDNSRIFWAILNPFDYENNCYEADLEKRFHADSVIVLALTHHLILKQGFPLSFILERFERFTEKYLFIEFMPLGLHNGVNAPPIPSWYNEDWFKWEFIKRFELIEHVQLEENRILFIGKKLNRLGSSGEVTHQ